MKHVRRVRDLVDGDWKETGHREARAERFLSECITKTKDMCGREGRHFEARPTQPAAPSLWVRLFGKPNVADEPRSLE